MESPEVVPKQMKNAYVEDKRKAGIISIRFSSCFGAEAPEVVPKQMKNERAEGKWVAGIIFIHFSSYFSIRFNWFWDVEASEVLLKQTHFV